MRITIVTDAWAPQVNGVVTTIRNTVRCLKEFGHDVSTITPDRFSRRRRCPGYHEIELSLFPRKQVARHRGWKAGRYPYHHRRATRPCCPQLVFAESIRICVVLPHAFS